MSTPSVSFLKTREADLLDLVVLYPVREEDYTYKIAGTIQHITLVYECAGILHGEKREFSSVQIDGVEQSKLTSEQVKERLQSIKSATSQKGPHEVAKLNDRILNIIKI